MKYLKKNSCLRHLQQKNNKMKFTLRFIFCFCLLLTGLESFSQDVIILKNGDEIQSKVTEVLTDIIKYKKWNNQDGPVYSSNKADVFMIKYQNGTKDVFNITQIQTTPKPIDNSNKVLEIAKPFMENQVSSESKGACKLIEFNKQNGIEKEIFGQKTYTLEYRLMIELQKDFWKASGDKFLHADWYWTNFSVLDKKGSVYDEEFTNNYAYFTKGTKVEITGVIVFENTDNGWRITGVNMFSSGYNNKTARVFANVKMDDPTLTKPIPKEKLPVDPTPIKPVIKEKPPADSTKAGYEGDYKDGKKYGHGKMVYKSGNTYEGEWKDDEKNGQGKFYYYSQGYSQGLTYVGGWKNDKREGYGTLTWDDGFINYQGEFKNGVPDGRGITYDMGNKVYDGEWKNGKKDGKGTFISRTEVGTTTYSGDWVNDKSEGQGTMTTKLSNGGSATFTGEFKNGDKFNGVDYITTDSGIKSSQNYKNGRAGKLNLDKTSLKNR